MILVTNPWQSCSTTKQSKPSWGGGLRRRVCLEEGCMLLFVYPLLSVALKISGLGKVVRRTGSSSILSVENVSGRTKA